MSAAHASAARRRASDIQLHDVTVAYERHPAVHHVSGTFEAGCLTAVIGPNGAGKSTLLRAVLGLVPTSDGRVDLGGLRRRDIAFLPQHAEIDRQFPICVLDLVLTGFYPVARLLGGIGAAARRRASEALAMVGLAGFEQRQIGSLSVGQFQRALFARVIVQDAAAILLDEPFAAIDAQTTQDLVRLIEHWHGEGRSVILVAHDLELVRRHFPQTLLLARQVIAWGATAQALAPAHLEVARQMSEAWDTSAGQCEIPHTARSAA